MAGSSVRPSRAKDRSCRRPCQVAGVERRVGSVGKARPIRASPARISNEAPVFAERVCLRVWRNPRAKDDIIPPLIRKLAIISQPRGPKESPLGQSKVGARNGSQPSEQIG